MKFSNRLKVVVFDWDGTLVNSHTGIVTQMQQVAKEMAWRIPKAEDILHSIGLSLPVSLAQLFPEKSPQDRDTFIQAYRAFYQSLGAQAVQAFVGSQALLETLRTDGYTLAVATGKGQVSFQSDLSHLDWAHYFQCFRCGDQTASKPDPQMLHELMQELEVGPDDMIMIGDSIYDLQMAKSAGVRAIGATYGVHNREMLAAYQPVGLADDVYAIKQFIDQLEAML